MNEKRIQEVVEIEKRAQELLANAKREAELLPIQAEEAARVLIEKERASAREAASRMLAEAQSSEGATDIMSRTQEKMKASEDLAEKNLERAVAYVFDRVIGKA